MNCRFCNASLSHVFADLGQTPLANSYPTKSEITRGEHYFPLLAYVCSKCFLVQLEQFEDPSKIFRHYAYLSSYSKSWLNHAKEFSEMAINRFNLNKSSHVIEIASNDGYLLQYFKKQKIPVLGIEPALNIAKISRKKGIATVSDFFGANTAKKIAKTKEKSDLLIAFNVLPHVPNLKDFVKGIKIILKPSGIAIIQFSAYILKLIQKNEYDTIYHEHFSYFSLLTLSKIFSHFGLSIFDVQEIDVHGGSLRVFLKHKNNSSISISKNVKNKIQQEKKFGLDKLETYSNFQKKIAKSKIDIWKFFQKISLEKKSVVGYGAPAKACTTLNFCGIKNDLLPFTVDVSIEKQGLFIPGTHIPIYSPKKIFQTKPDYIIILAWNLKDEIIDQMKKIQNWNGKFVIFTPKVRILN
jgi:hypothetical protein